MKVEEIQSLAKIMREADLTCLEVTEGDKTIRLERELTVAPVAAVPAAVPQSVPIALQAVGDSGAEPANYREVKSPLVGVFYAAPSPEGEPYVKTGSRVKKGDVLCVIEAMKLLNELNSDVDGEIISVCAESGQVVEYGQTLFKVR
jgi:acetyl-CoA carboxylase biotin carboxyl carrier protein